MPSLAGIIGARAADAHQLETMAARLVSEPRSNSGRHVEPGIGVSVAWAGLRGVSGAAILHWNAARDVCVVFVGEEFARASDVEELRRRSLRGGLEGAGYLVAMYEAHGTKFLRKLDGWVSGLLIDLRRNIAILFNDRYGLNRIYWRQADGSLYFSSEAKALLALFPESRRLDDDAVAEMFSVGCVLQDRTLFPDLALLPPASQWTVDAGGGIDKQRYFTPAEWEAQTTLDDESFYAELKESFASLLPRYFRGPGRVGMSLTGGLDGRMVMAWARPARQELPCYSFGGIYRDCADVRIARQVASHCGQPHTTIGVGRDFLAQFETLAPQSVYLSDGTMDVSGAVELYVNRLARDIAPIRMTGNYGSEVLRANVAFRPRVWSRDLFEPEFFARIERAAETYRVERNVADLTFVAFKQVPWHHYARLSVEQSQLTLRSPFLDNELVALMYRAPAALRSSTDLSLRLVHDGDPGLARMPTDRGLVYGRQTIGGRARNLLQEFTAKAEYVYDYGMPQGFAKVDRLFAPLAPERLFLGRHKFYHFRTWYRHQLAPYVQQVLLDPRTLGRSYLRPEKLRRMVMDHVAGRGNYTLEIHRALTMELTHRELLDQ